MTIDRAEVLKSWESSLSDPSFEEKLSEDDSYCPSAY